MPETRPVKMSDIRIPDFNELNQGKLLSLKNSPDSLEKLLHSKSDPIKLTGKKPPYEVYTGRHRVYLAYQRGIQLIPAVLD